MHRHTIRTFRISLHIFIFGLLICEMISRLISQKVIGESFHEISRALFTIPL